jgi:hypothetical protein
MTYGPVASRFGRMPPSGSAPNSSSSFVISRSPRILFRTFADPKDPADVKAANALQDRIACRQKSSGTFGVPRWDSASLKKVRDAINVLAATRTGCEQQSTTWRGAG